MNESRSAPELFVTQGHDGIDARGAASGDRTSSQRDDEQEQSDAQESEPIARSDAEKQTPQKAREREAGGHADGDARQGGADALAKNHSHDVATLRAESHADADFPGALQHHM